MWLRGWRICCIFVIVVVPNFPPHWGEGETAPVAWGQGTTKDNCMWAYGSCEYSAKSCQVPGGRDVGLPGRCGWRGAEVGDKVKKWGVGVRKKILGTGVAGSERSLHTSEKVVSEWLYLNNAPFSQQAVMWALSLLLLFSLEIRKPRQWNI